MSMYLSKSLPRVLVPKYYKSVDNLIEDAFRALLNLKPGLKVSSYIGSKEDIESGLRLI